MILYLQTRVQVCEFKPRNISALWRITSIHLKLSQHVLHSGSSECSLSLLSWGEGGVTPHTSQQFITLPDNHQVQAEPDQDPTQVPVEHADWKGPSPATFMTDRMLQCKQLGICTD